MSTVDVSVPQFEGPLATFLKLIVSREIDIFSVKLSQLVEQVVDKLLCPDSPFDTDDIGDHVVMCASLLRIKSRRLLPIPERDEEEEILPLEEEDPEVSALRYLAEYQHYQTVASMLEGLAEESSRLFPRGALEIPEGNEQGTLSHVSLLSLVAALEQALQSQASSPMAIEHEEYSLRAGMDHLRLILPKGTTLPFLEVFPKGATRLVIVVVFLGLLELIRIGEVVVTDYQGSILIHREGGLVC